MTLRFSTALHRGVLKKRYKRFLADVLLDSGELVTAHCPNTGSMKTCFETNSTVWLSENQDPKRKLKWTWEFCENKHGLIGINTHRPNKIVAEAIQQGHIKELSGYSAIKLEAPYGKNSRIDILLEDPKLGRCYVEIKNTTLLIDDSVRFPDAVTARGLKHIDELLEMKKNGNRAVLIFFVSRSEGSFFAPADLIDSKYGAALRMAKKSGLEILAIRANASTQEITVGKKIPIKL